MATTNFREFALGVRHSVGEFDSARRARCRAVGLRGLRGLVLNTRVDTGRARGNWQTTVGRPATGQIERNDAAGSEGSVDTVAVESVAVLEWDADDPLWFHNGVDYIEILEGKDKMLAGTVNELRQWLRSSGR